MKTGRSAPAAFSGWTGATSGQDCDVRSLSGYDVAGILDYGGGAGRWTWDRSHFIAAFVVIGALGMVWHFRRSGSFLQQWADQNGYRFIDQEYRTFLRGLFFMTTSKGQTVYYVTVQDYAGWRREGLWVRCGGWFLGLFSDNVEILWDD